MNTGLAKAAFAWNRSNQRGFALVAVIWSLGLIILLGTTVVVGAKYRARLATADGSAIAAAAAAESSINLAIAELLTPKQNVKFPLRCRMPGGDQTFITIEEETGKVDLNTASQVMLERLFEGLSRDGALGRRIAAEILKARNTVQNPNEKGSQSQTDKNGKRTTAFFRFTSIMELDHVVGMSPSLFRKALPFVTVGSGRNDPEREAASPALLRLLGLDVVVGGPRRPSASGSVTIRVDVTLPDRSRYVREALIAFESGNGQPYVIREWRRGNATEPLRDRGRLPACVRV